MKINENSTTKEQIINLEETITNKGTTLEIHVKQ